MIYGYIYLLISILTYYFILSTLTKSCWYF